MDFINELKNFLDDKGRLKQYPAKRKLQKIVTFYLASKLEPNRRYTEKELNAALNEWCVFGDYCLLRRELYDGKFLNRTYDGSSYWMEPVQPILAEFEIE